MKLSREKAFQIISESVSIDSIWMRHTTSVHIAVIMKRGKIIDIAINSPGTRSKGCGYETRTIHAERAVLKKVGDLSKLDGAILFVIRIMRGTGEVGYSKPCHSCKCHLEKCIKQHGLKQVYYS